MCYLLTLRIPTIDIQFGQSHRKSKLSFLPIEWTPQLISIVTSVWPRNWTCQDVTELFTSPGLFNPHFRTNSVTEFHNWGIFQPRESEGGTRGKMWENTWTLFKKTSVKCTFSSFRALQHCPVQERRLQRVLHRTRRLLHLVRVRAEKRETDHDLRGGFRNLLRL